MPEKVESEGKASSMSWVKSKKREPVDLEEFKDLDEDSVLQTLTEEEIKELDEAIDPENLLLPIHLRNKDQTTKEPTGPFDRPHLLNHLQKQAEESDIGKDYVPYKKETRGRVWKPKERPKRDQAPMLPDDLSDVLENASEEELLELAACLGIHSMLTQNQSHTVDDATTGKTLKGSGLKKYKPGIVKATKIKKPDLTAKNELNIEEAMGKLKGNDPKLDTLNLNNHADVTPEILEEVIKQLETNTNLQRLYLANTRMTDRVAKLLGAALSKNYTLKSLNMESNFLTGEGIMAIVRVIETNKTLKELKLSNQSAIVGCKVEREIVTSLAKNTTLLNFGMGFDTQGPRITCAEILVRNNDFLRKERTEAEEQYETIEEEDEGED